MNFIIDSRINDESNQFHNLLIDSLFEYIIFLISNNENNFILNIYFISNKNLIFEIYNNKNFNFK